MATKAQTAAVIDDTLAARRRRLAARARDAKLKKPKAAKSNGSTTNTKATKHRPSGTMRPDEMYTIFGLQDLFGIGKGTLRRAQAEGLQAIVVGSRKMFRGEDLIRHFAKRKPK